MLQEVSWRRDFVDENLVFKNELFGLSLNNQLLKKDKEDVMLTCTNTNRASKIQSATVWDEVIMSRKS